ncbi:MAG: flippase-like domain-containing protein, partial [Spirochaetes bacterium]|nr:flippase-like domain-containing protein [Spirochaetota bacterium]
KEINIFSFFIKDILAKKRMTFLWLFLLTALSWIVRFLIAVAVIWGLAGFIINVVQVVSVQTVTNFLAFFAPSPGASGVVEFSMKKVFEQVILNGEFIFIFVVIWRLINYYLNVILGGLVVVKVLKIKKDSLDKEEKEIEQDYRKTPRQDFEDSA